MIFVTVGTHEQPFNRLVAYMDGMKRNGRIDEEVIIQTGYSTYEPEYCTWQKYYPYQQMLEFIKEANIVITHGGPSSFIMPLQVGKIPIVVPRQKKFDEHVNDHQVEFCRAVSERMGTIILVENVDKLEEIICNYDSVVSDRRHNISSNNERFNQEIEKLVENLMKSKS